MGREKNGNDVIFEISGSFRGSSIRSSMDIIGLLGAVLQEECFDFVAFVWFTFRAVRWELTKFVCGSVLGHPIFSLDMLLCHAVSGTNRVIKYGSRWRKQV